MDEAELRDLIPPKEENPLLKRNPLNLGSRFVRLSAPEQTIQVDTLPGSSHLTLLLFAAQWCNISKSFIPALKGFYEDVNLENKKVEIIYVGLDKVKKDYEAFTKSMPWVGLPFGDQKISGLKEFYDIRAIPKMVMIDSKGEQVPNDCRQDIYNMDGDSAYQKWAQLRSAQDKSIINYEIHS